MENRFKRSLTLNTAVDLWSRGLLGRIQATLSRQKSNRMHIMDAINGGDLQYWEVTKQQSSAYALLGRRPRMEDRFIIEENINNTTGIAFFAVFDGHGGEFAADFAKEILVKNIYNKIIETKRLLHNQPTQILQQQQDAQDYTNYDTNAYLKRKGSRKDESNKENEPTMRRRESFKKSLSTADDSTNNKQHKVANNQNEIPDAYTQKLNSLMRISGTGANLIKNSNNKDDNNYKTPPQNFDGKFYIDNGKINFGKLITDEILAADYKLVEVAKKTTNIAGTTAIIAVIDGTTLIVANVGDSRAVMCNARGIAIPLSFDHKPQQVRERKRIHDAGGFIEFRGVWRVAGILATSRALGDYPLKDKNLVIANPDILTFDLNDHKPSFLILASDGLWDTFTNEEACTFIKQHLHEPDYGAKSLTMQSYQRGSIDNITVLVIVFKNASYRIGTSSLTLSAVNDRKVGGGIDSAIRISNENSAITKS